MNVVPELDVPVSAEGKWTMQVILLENVGKLGNLGDQVNVKSGYGRNYLIPYGKAVPATEQSIAEFEQRRAELEAAAAERVAAAQARAAKLEELGAVSVAANASDEGKLFGSIGTREIADLATAAGVEISKSEVLMPTGAIREVGEFTVEVLLHAEVVQSIQVIVTAE